MTYEVKPIFLGTIEADQSGFTYMAFPGTPIVLDVVFFLIKGAPKTILFDTGSWAALMAKYWPGKGVDYQTFEEGLAAEGLTPDDIDIIIQSISITTTWATPPSARMLRCTYRKKNGRSVRPLIRSTRSIIPPNSTKGGKCG